MQYHLEFEFEAPIHIHYEKLRELARGKQNLGDILAVQKQALQMLHTQFSHQTDASLCWYVWMNENMEEPVQVFFEETDNGFHVLVTNPATSQASRIDLEDAPMSTVLEKLKTVLGFIY
ncbi:hypothetical protein [Bacillus cereus]|uniref:hypothetical protein n=1 Tax=Bacillus cereus TaxID=1396 RepID=UPI000BFC250A|nr:hypothetical protein [Bacillus cereus]PGR83509.1 hypothetical protein COC63_05855 [Bacillus cereus]